MIKCDWESEKATRVGIIYAKRQGLGGPSDPNLFSPLTTHLSATHSTGCSWSKRHSLLLLHGLCLCSSPCLYNSFFRSWNAPLSPSLRIQLDLHSLGEALLGYIALSLFSPHQSLSHHLTLFSLFAHNIFEIHLRSMSVPFLILTGLASRMHKSR